MDDEMMENYVAAACVMSYRGADDVFCGQETNGISLLNSLTCFFTIFF